MHLLGCCGFEWRICHNRICIFKLLAHKWGAAQLCILKVLFCRLPAYASSFAKFTEPRKANNNTKKLLNFRSAIRICI